MNASIAAVAAWGIAVPLMLVVVAIVRRNAWRIDLACGTLGGIATIALVKLSAAFVHEPRPFIVEHVRPLVAHAADNAFPSDHLAACGLAVGYLWTRSRALAVLALLVAVAIAGARVLARARAPALRARCPFRLSLRCNRRARRALGDALSTAHSKRSASIGLRCAAFWAG